MKKRFYMMACGLIGFGMMAQAQVIASLGFEEGDKQFVNPDSSQFATFYADHINLYRGDAFDEKFEGDRTGDGKYALKVTNSGDFLGNTWDRGIKMRGLEIEPETSYRVTFWVKASPTFINPNDGATNNTSIKSSLSIGKENLEAPFLTQNGTEYWYNWTSGMTGDWRRLSFVSYFSSKDVQDQYFDNYDNNTLIKPNEEDPTKMDTIAWTDVYGGMTSFHDEYFLTINMYNPGEYILDDIVIEKANITGCTYNWDAIRVDFGYPTNIADLAKASEDPIGIRLLPNEWVKVMNGEEEVEVFSVECHDDGYLYIFVADESVLGDNEENIRVSFTPGDDCPVIYTSDKRPSMDISGEVKVLPFENEVIYLDENIDELNYAWLPPTMISSQPENGSFDLDPETFKELVVTYDRKLSVGGSTTAILTDGNGVLTVDLTDGMYLSEDGCSLCIPIGERTNGEYYVTISSAENEYGIASYEEQKIKFSIGIDNDTTKSEVIYAPDFNAVQAGTFPKGWVWTGDNGEVHEYGLNDDGSIYNYNYGGVNPNGYQGGPRMYEGFSGDFSKAIYWRSAGEAGTLTYGAQVEDYLTGEDDVTVSPDMDPEIALYLTPRKYQVSFRMAAWKVEPKFDFILERVGSTEPVAQFLDVVAVPNMNGATGYVEGSVEISTEFTVDKAGYYVLKFYTDPAWQEMLLANVRLISKPSDAAYYKQLLGEAVDSALVVQQMAADASYDGETKTALNETLEYAQNTHFTAPSAVENVRTDLFALCGKMLTRITNVDNYTPDMQELRDSLASYEGKKYAQVKECVEAEKFLAEYGEANLLEMNDSVLNAVTAELARQVTVVTNVRGYVDALTYRLMKAVETANNIKTDAPSLILDAESAIFDDDRAADYLNDANKATIYQILAENAEIPAEMKDTLRSLTETEASGAYRILATGIDVTGYVKNPNFYSYLTNGTDSMSTENTPGWSFDGFIHTSGDAYYVASDVKPVADTRINGYRNMYNAYQRISNLPVGVYDISMETRTATGKIGVNDSTGRPDMFFWVSTAEGDTLFTAFAEAAMDYTLGWGGCPVSIKGVEVKEGTVLSFGVKEAYTSGKSLNTDGTDQGSWDTNTYADDVRLYLTAPLAGYDYKKAADGIADVEAAEPVSYEYYTVDGIRLTKPQRGINIVKTFRADGTVDVKTVIVK